jgi:hypothetical protein
MMASRKSSKIPIPAIYRYLTEDKGLGHNHAIGMVANIYGESGFNPNAVGDNGASYGLFQFQGSRRRALERFAGSARPHWKQQIDYALSEPEGRDYLAQDFRGPVDAVRHFVYHFERPANKAADTIKRTRHLSSLMAELREEGGARNPFAYASGGRRGFPGKDFRADLFEDIFGGPSSGPDPDLYKGIFDDEAPAAPARLEPSQENLAELFDIEPLSVPEAEELLPAPAPVQQAQAPAPKPAPAVAAGIYHLSGTPPPRDSPPCIRRADQRVTGHAAGRR